MARTELPDPARKCPSCGQLVKLLWNGSLRRHYAVDAEGRSHLCEGSHATVGAEPRAQRRLDL
jgi:hypothetical protein